MTLAYSEFVSNPTNLAADIRNAILASSDWARPNATDFPNMLKATTTRGATMVIDLSGGGAADVQRLKALTWKNHDGTVGYNGGGSLVRNLWYRASSSVITMTSPLYVVVSAGKEHLFISVEGPRPGDPGAPTSGSVSLKNYIFMCDLVPYHANDTNPTIVSHGSMSAAYGAALQSGSHVVHASQGRTQVNAPGRIITLEFPSFADTNAITLAQRKCWWDNNYYLFPYVLVEDQDGMRGWLSSFFYAGWSVSPDYNDMPTAPVGSRIQFEGNWYKLHAVCKTSGENGINNNWGAFGAANNGGGFTVASRTPVVAVPCPAPV